MPKRGMLNSRRVPSIWIGVPAFPRAIGLAHWGL